MIKTAQTVLPWSKVKETVAELHGGHLGVSKTLEKARQQYYWPP
jgi:hypothetical protein